MIQCKKCGATLEDSAKFCNKCGELTATPTATVFCKDCGKQTDTETGHCRHCGAEIEAYQVGGGGINGAAQTVGKAVRKVRSGGLNLKLIIPIGAAAVVVIALVVLFLTGVIKLPFGGGGSAELKTVLYIKDDELYSSPVNKATPVQITERLSKDVELKGLSARAFLTPAINGDETRLVYVDKVKNSSSDGYDLFFRNPQNLKKEPTEISSGVKGFIGNKDLTALIYLKGSKGKLCYYDFKTEAELESKEIEYFDTDEKVSTIIYYNTDYDLMIRSGKSFSTQAEIASKIDNDGAFSVNEKDGVATGVWYRKKDNLYYYEISKKESVKIDSDVVNAYAIGSAGELYYSVLNKDGSTYTLNYLAKLGEKAVEVSDSFSYAEAISADNAIVIFKEKSSSSKKGDTYTSVVAIGSEIAGDFEEDDEQFRISKDGTAIYYLSAVDEDDEIGALTKRPISGGKLGKAETLADEVYDFFIAGDGKTIYYFEDDEEEDLFLVGQSKAVVEDVYVYDSKGDGAGILVMTDWDDEDGGKLVSFDGKTATVVASDVNAYLNLGSKNIAYITEYDDSEGKLFLYNGSKTPLLIDKDVTALLPVRKQGEYIGVWYD